MKIPRTLWVEELHSSYTLKKRVSPLLWLTNKTVKIFTTTGAPSFIYMITGTNRRLKNTCKEQIIEFCGMKLDSFNIFDGVDTSAKNLDKVLVGYIDLL